MCYEAQLLADTNKAFTATQYTTYNAIHKIRGGPVSRLISGFNENRGNKIKTSESLPYLF
jgi:hypothetical protein